MIDLDPIVLRDKACAETWWKGPPSTMANAIRDRRALLGELEAALGRISDLEGAVFALLSCQSQDQWPFAMAQLGRVFRAGKSA